MCDAVRGNVPGTHLKDEFDDDIDMVWLDAATHLANAVEANERSKNAAAVSKGRIEGRSTTASRAVDPKRAIDPKTPTPTRNHRHQQQPTSTQTAGIPQYLSRMAAAAQSAGSAAFGRAVAKPRPTPSQRAMPPPPPRQQPQKAFTGKPLVAWTPPAAPAGKARARAGKAPGCSQFEPIVLD